MKHVTLIVLIITLSFCAHCDKTAQAQDDLIRVHIGGIPLDVEVAATPETRNRGLMYRTSMPENQGMLFVFPDEKQRTFWMKNCLMPIDVGFFDARPFLLNVQQMQPDDGQGRWSSAGAAKYAVETNKDWWQKNYIRRGAELELPHPIQGI